MFLMFKVLFWWMKKILFLVTNWRKKKENNILFINFGIRWILWLLKKIVYSYEKFKLIKEIHNFNQLSNKKGNCIYIFLFKIGFCFCIPWFETFTFTKIHFLPPFWGKSLLLELYPRDSNTEQYWWDRLKLKKIESGRNKVNNAERRSIT